MLCQAAFDMNKHAGLKSHRRGVFKSKTGEREKGVPLVERQIFCMISLGYDQYPLQMPFLHSCSAMRSYSGPRVSKHGNCFALVLIKQRVVPALSRENEIHNFTKYCYSKRIHQWNKIDIFPNLPETYTLWGRVFALDPP